MAVEGIEVDRRCASVEELPCQFHRIFHPEFGREAPSLFHLTLEFERRGPTREGGNLPELRTCRHRHETRQNRDPESGGLRITHEAQVFIRAEEELGDRKLSPGLLFCDQPLDVFGPGSR